MLFLKRKPQQTVVIIVGKYEIIVRVNKVENQTVQLGFQAPDDVLILRSELT